MKALLDTHILLWNAGRPDRLSDEARKIIDAPETELFFSAVSLWEVAIKTGLGRSDFSVDARLLRRGLLDHGFREIPVTGDHAVAIDGLPPIHKDPFDRILIAQAKVEGITLLTSDVTIARYGGAIHKI